MLKLTNEVIAAIEKGERVVLCTILASSGSSPRGAGTRMAVFEDGRMLGTVGGGKVELLAAQDAKEVLKTGNTHIRAFCLAADQVASIGMICGGNVTVYYQLLTQAELPKLYQMRKALQTDANSWLYLLIKDDCVEKFEIVDAEEAKNQPELYTYRAVYQKGEPTVYVEPLVRAGRVYVFGGGHVGQALVPVLANVGFRVTLFDNRKELADRAHFPAAEQVILGDYEHISAQVTLTENDYVVIMTPGHQSDYALLEQVLRYKTKYVGCIGSRHKIARTQQLLREAGISEEAIASVHSPIGLTIGAETPAEIAIAIAAEMIQCRAETR
ncbi:MAG: XdhC family protein [Oscillospiraceae bacterium]|nr:XdhC family protein [Oscillospiraceae bacterium]